MAVLPEKYSPPPAGLSPAGLLAWIVRSQWTTVLQGTACDVIWLLGLALTPWAIGRVIDDGIGAGDTAAFFGWLGLVLWLQLQHSLIQGLRDRAGILNFRRGYGRVQQVLVHEVTRAGAHAKSADAAATSAVWDAFPIAFVPITVGGLTAAVVSYVVVGVLLLRDSLLLGLLVIVGVPVFSLALTAMVKPLEKRQSVLRGAAGDMNAVAVDVVRGIRVVKGIGGERQALTRYRTASQATRAKGRAVAWPMAATQAMNVIISGVLVVGLTGLGAVLVVSGSLRVGELVAFYGYAGFMVLPVTLVADAVATIAQARVGARRIVAICALPDAGVSERVAAPDGLAAAAPDASETVGIVADGIEPLVAAEALRDLIAPGDPAVLVAHAVPFLFSGTLRTLLDPSGDLDDERIVAALRAADVDEVLVSLEEGLDAEIEDRGVVFSGGQRQRLGLARALLRDPGILILVDPTSSVDAATEARVAQGIRAFRAGGTAIVTSSPLVLGVTDRVALVDAAGIRCAGPHEHLVRDDERYRRAVLRGEGMR